MTYLEFASAQDFLKAALKPDQTAISIRQLSRRLGFSSDRGVGMVLKGQRPMSAEMQARLAKLLKLTDKERVHLQSLVRQGKTETVETSTGKHARATTKLSEGELLHPLIPHYALAVLDILWIAGKNLKTLEIQARLRDSVSLNELRSTLEQLCVHGYIKQESHSFFRSLKDEEYLSTPPDVPSKAVRAIHRAQLSRAIETLDSESVLSREFIAKTVVIPRDQVPKIKRLLREKLEEIAQEIAMEQPAPDALVAQLNIQFFLQSK